MTVAARAWVFRAAVIPAVLALSTSTSAAPAPVPPEAKPFALGSMEVFALRDAENIVPNDAKTFGVGHTPGEVAAVLRKAGAPENEIRLPIDALLVKARGHVMLFDTGLGPHVHGVLIASLVKAGVRPVDVTDVFITHSHGDHVGGLVGSDGAPAFPNAVVHMSAREWDWMKSQPRNADIVQVISRQVKPFEPGGELAPGVRTVALYGHTPGHVGYQISSGRARLLDFGDLAHSSIISLAKPDWTVEYDNDSEAGKATRKATLAQLAKSGELAFGPHMPFPGVGHVVAWGEGYVWKPASP